MKLLVTYDNPHYGEHDEYTTTLEELVDSFNGMMNKKIVEKELKYKGEAIIENGYATTTVKLIHQKINSTDQRWDYKCLDCKVRMPRIKSRPALVVTLHNPTCDCSHGTNLLDDPLHERGRFIQYGLSDQWEKAYCQKCLDHSELRVWVGGVPSILEMGEVAEVGFAHNLEVAEEISNPSIKYDFEWVEMRRDKWDVNILDFRNEADEQNIRMEFGYFHNISNGKYYPIVEMWHDDLLIVIPKEILQIALESGWENS